MRLGGNGQTTPNDSSSGLNIQIRKGILLILKNIVNNTHIQTDKQVKDHNPIYKPTLSHLHDYEYPYL